MFQESTNKSHFNSKLVHEHPQHWVKIDRNSGPNSGAGVNRVSVRDANNPMSTGHGEAGTKLLSSSEDGHYNNQQWVQ
jgi:hypothetical protein